MRPSPTSTNPIINRKKGHIFPRSIRTAADDKGKTSRRRHDQPTMHASPPGLDMHVQVPGTRKSPDLETSRVFSLAASAGPAPLSIIPALSCACLCAHDHQAAARENRATASSKVFFSFFIIENSQPK